jgi:hypothetical protein
MKIIFFICVVKMFVGFILQIVKTMCQLFKDDIAYSKPVINGLDQSTLRAVYLPFISRDEVELFVTQKAYLKLSIRT